MTKKLDLSSVYDYFKEHGCTLLTDHYTNSHQKLDFLCRCGEKGKSSLNKFKASKRCRSCGIKICGNYKKLNFSYVKKFFLERNCELLQDFYESSDKKLKYRCECGNISYISFSNFRLGKRCRNCLSRRISFSKRLSDIYIRDLFTLNNCVLLSSYINKLKKVKFQCSCKKLSEITILRFEKIKKCNICYKNELIDCRKKHKKNTVVTYKERPKGKNHFAWKEDREKIKLRKLIVKKSCSMLRRSLVKFEQHKKDSLYSILGYTSEDLIRRLESFPEWEDLKEGNWHLDHIYPITAFIDFGITDLKIINGLDNLQPLSQFDNISKGGRYDQNKFKIWISNKIYIEKDPE